MRLLIINVSDCNATDNTIINYIDEIHHKTIKSIMWT